jgi:phage baseplate assembly protein W
MRRNALKTLLLRDGDLVPARRDYATISGTPKVAQDLRCALLEPLGNDRFHGGWGSTLNEFIASIAEEETRVAVESEVNRVIANYVAVQRDKIEADITGEAESRFTTDEILSRIRNVSVSISTETLRVSVVLQTVSGEVLTLDEAVA